MPIQEQSVQGPVDQGVFDSGTDEPPFRISKAVKHPDDMPLPFSSCSDAHELQKIMEAGGYVVATKGAEQYEYLCHLVELGYLSRHQCKPKGLGVYQFSITRLGREAAA